MTAVMAMSAVSASAQTVCGELARSVAPGEFQRLCVEESTVEFEETVTTSRECEVGNSGRQGTQAGTQTNIFEVTTTTTTREFFQGNNLKKFIRSEFVGEETSEPVLVEEGEFVATGKCKNNPGPQ
ncbi:MAG: hypothetical protein H0V53_14070 [Rubrobacter sp.]|nr:hypothetical protein [Rubrobacter sp.]